MKLIQKLLVVGLLVHCAPSQAAPEHDPRLLGLASGMLLLGSYYFWNCSSTNQKDIDAIDATTHPIHQEVKELRAQLSKIYPSSLYKGKLDSNTKRPPYWDFKETERNLNAIHTEIVLSKAIPFFLQDTFCKHLKEKLMPFVSTTKHECHCGICIKDSDTPCLVCSKFDEHLTKYDEEFAKLPDRIKKDIANEQQHNKAWAITLGLSGLAVGTLGLASYFKK